MEIMSTVGRPACQADKYLKMGHQNGMGMAMDMGMGIREYQILVQHSSQLLLASQ